MNDRERLAASVIGAMVGDALGLPYEGLQPRRAKRILPGTLRPRLLFGRAMMSDDGEHALMTAEALLSDGPLDRELGRRLRRWFLLIPAGIGLATIKACLRLCVGISPARSGVESAGNGAAMRAAAVGAYFAFDDAARERAVETVARVTHIHPDAIKGARLIALAAALTARGEIHAFEAIALEIAPGWPFDFPGDRGPSGWVRESVPAALGVWRRHPNDFRAAIEEAVALGGDTDTVAAMVGGIVGIVDPPPAEWLESLWEPVRGQAYVRRLAEGAKPSAPSLTSVPRNAVFLAAVLTHGFRRLLP